jgi:Gpi18-like mannosyltransferase
MFVLMRIVTAVAAYWIVSYQTPRIDWAVQPIYYLHDIAFTTQGALRAWLEPWYRWDTGWYIHIAYAGYHADDGSIIFGPLYPLLIRLTAPFVGGDFLAASILIGNVCCFIGMYLLCVLVAEELGLPLARQAVVLLLAFPSAFYFSRPILRVCFWRCCWAVGWPCIGNAT